VTPKIRRLIDAIEAENKAGSELWFSARRGEDTPEQRARYQATHSELKAARTDMNPRFIVVNPADPAENTSGHLGVLTLSNVYLSAYADYSRHPHPSTLEKGQRTQATFRLSGEKGTYDIVRVD
jgi:hypothetical protein